MASNGRHLKRHSMPTAWPVKRKNINFITRPNPGSHKRKYTTALVILLRDVLGYATTTKEAKSIVHTSDVLINGKKVTDIKAPVGIFDVLEIKKVSEKFTLILDNLGKLKLVPTKEDLVYLKISKKTQLSKAFQLNFSNGFNILVDEKTFKSIKVGDSIVYDFIKKSVVSIMNLVEKSFVYIFDGNFKGQFGEVESFTHYNGLTRDVAFVNIEGVSHSTAKDYCFVIGKSKKDLVRFA